MNIIHMNFGRFTEPAATEECREAYWSEGRACRTCPKKDCYRNGWKKAQVDADNKKIVAARRKQLQGQE